jgi:hypothetical protein
MLIDAPRLPDQSNSVAEIDIKNRVEPLCPWLVSPSWFTRIISEIA